MRVGRDPRPDEKGTLDDRGTILGPPFEACSSSVPGRFPGRASASTKVGPEGISHDPFHAGMHLSVTHPRLVKRFLVNFFVNPN